MSACDPMRTTGTAGSAADADPHPSSVSVVVLTHQRRDELAQTLRRLATLPEQPPLIVVDNGSSDGTAALVGREFPQAELLQLPRNIGAAARNLGVARVRTPYVAFCDDDTWWAPGSLAQAARLFDAYPRLGALSARVLVGPAQQTDPACERMAASPLDSQGLPGPRLIAFMAGAVVMRLAAFRAAGGYEPRLFLGAEEALLALDLAAAGWDMAYADQLLLQHNPSAARDPGRRRLWLARNRLWIAWLRLPADDAMQQTRLVLAEARAAGMAGPVLRAAIAGLPWLLRVRRPLPPDVLAMWRRIFRPGTLAAAAAAAGPAAGSAAEPLP